MMNIALLVFLLWVGGVVFVALGMAFVKALDLLEGRYDD